MSFAGRLRSRVTVYRRFGETPADLGEWTAGASRRADITAASNADQEGAAGVVGVEQVTITVRLDVETRGWDTAMRLVENSGPSRLNRIFEMTAPPQVDDSGRWLIIRAAAGGVDLDLD
ncbi:head-tail adaptor protein [Hyphomonas sp.]|uniref:head-tail adaptor protein n=1 Tax=Hyphomonas sp. TaxID=87 RepID=UPI0025BCC719|nr:head-tail adaptor protein [Hyphomonas sp.]MBI1401452.1 hypothetical protein [Hyphomonas sp.]